MLVAMMSWKQCGHVIKMMSQALTAALDNAHLHSEGDTIHHNSTKTRGKVSEGLVTGTTFK